MRTLTTLLLVSLLGAAPAFAAEVDAKIDAVKADIKSDKADVKDDKKDLKSVGKLRKKWEKAVEKDNVDTIAKVAEDIQEWLTSELAENRQETSESRAELVEGGGELREAPPEGVKPMPDGTIKGYNPEPDSASQADDRRDLRGDRAEARKTREIATELRDTLKKAERGTLRGPGAAEITKALARLEKAAEHDLAQSEGELAEDEAQLERLKERS